MNYNSLEIDLAKQFDEKDSLKHFRDEFISSKSNLIYLDGNSLGRLPFKTRKHLDSVINNQWGDRLIRSWNENWYNLPAIVGAKISKLIGAREDEVIISDSTSINLYKLVYAALQINGNKKKILTDEFNFPSDHYIIQGILKQLNADFRIEILKSQDGITIPVDSLETQVDDETALVVLSHVAFKSSFLYDLKKVTDIVHKRGALILWDLSHSVGAVDIELNKANADFAIGCTYKYLNGGPGSPAFLYVRNDLREKLVSPIWGWFGDDNPFEFRLDFKSAKGIQKFLVGTPPILSLAAIDSSIDITINASIKKIRNKSIQLSEYLLFLFDKKLKTLDFNLGSPTNFEERGSHVSIQHEEAYRICQAMMDENNEVIIIPDFRSPNNIRLGLSPLYNSFEDVWIVVDNLVNIISHKSYLKYNKNIIGVT